jgi:FMN reductase
MSVLLIAGSPSERSRTAALLQAVGERLAFRGAQVNTLRVRDLPPQALLLADFGHPAVIHAVGQVAAADIVVVATPVYKAAYSGVLKVLLDVLPQTALKGKTVLPLATGGSAHHMLALDYALRPVLQSLGAKHILPGVYATDAQVVSEPDGRYRVDADIAERLDDAVNILVNDYIAPTLNQAGRFSAVQFSQVRCSV